MFVASSRLLLPFFLRDKASLQTFEKRGFATFSEVHSSFVMMAK
ncbi:Hypothetical protein Eab7_2569 [Exiguobacterium antarcticum B7]|nr:Hypothetical protein Eab7_2569 [Exiguobacterium antarcticum B7]